LGTVIVVLGPGDVLGDRYRLDEFVASGGMGQVFRATDKTLNRTVAVKVLLPGLTSDAEFGSRFRAEARIMASIGHKGVVGVYDYGETPEGTMFLVMAFVEGRPLGERITREGGLSAEETMAIVAQAADALHAAHSNGIIHRDVKPNNLLVGGNGAVTLVDFGVARSSNVTSVTKVNAVIGTAL
jgi:serine/threonine protein kinase